MDSANDKLKVLFMCTANSCRSQMAEGWAEHLKGNCIEAFSAGVSPAKVSERAIEVMAEAGVDISDHMSKHVDDLAGIEFDYVVTVCDNAKEQCPIYPGSTKVLHRGFEDPAGLIGTVDEVMAKFREVRDQIREFIETLPGGFEDL